MGVASTAAAVPFVPPGAPVVPVVPGTAAAPGAVAFGAAAACWVAAAAGAANGVPAAATGIRVSTGALAGFGGALWQAASIASTLALTNRFDQLLTDLHLAVTAWIELRQRGEALLHPLIVGAVLRPRRVDFVQFDGLLLERESLLLEQYVVLLQ